MKPRQIFALILLPLLLGAAAQAQIDRKARVESASGGEKIKLAVEYADEQAKASDHAVAGENYLEAKNDLADVAYFAKVASDSAIDLRKREKDTEIRLRKIAKKLTDVKNAAPYEDQADVQHAIDEVQAARDRILEFMFKKKH